MAAMWGMPGLATKFAMETHSPKTRAFLRNSFLKYMTSVPAFSRCAFLTEKSEPIPIPSTIIAPDLTGMAKPGVRAKEIATVAITIKPRLSRLDI